MNNEIGRKTTSLILMTIMVAGGLTFAIPSTVPDAHAQTPNLYVSAVNPTFDNTFGGLQVVEVIVNDPAISDQGDSEPRVTVDGTTLTMNQGDDGSWYSYFRVVADTDEDATNNQDNDDADSLWSTNAPTDNELVRTAHERTGTPPTDVARTVYELDLDGDFDIVYHKAGAPQTVSITYDDSTNNAINIDRTSYPRDAHVHVDVTDHVLNIDPTSEDVWSFTVDGGNPTYLLGSRNTGTDQQATANAARLGCEDDDCNFSIEDIGATDTNNIITLDGDPTPTTYILEETGANTGIFTITNNDESIIMTQDDAPRNQNTDITYSDETASVQISLNTADVRLSIADGTWNSGEPIDLTVVDADQNLNSKADEDQTVDESSSRIPTFTTGDPFTLSGDMTVRLYDSEDDADSATAVANSATYIEFDNRGLATITAHMIGTVANTPIDIEDDSIEDDVTDRLIITMPDDFGTNRSPDSIVVWFGMTFEAWLDRYTSTDDDDDFSGQHLLHVDVSSLGNSRLTLLATETPALANNDALGGSQIDLNAPGGSQMPLADFTNVGRSLQSLDVATLRTVATDNDILDHQMALIITPAVGTIETNEEYSIVFDVFRFGFNGDGASERFNDQIVRIEVEETGDNTSTFTGTLEYTMVNQLNALDDDIYFNDDGTYTDQLTPIGNEATFIVFEDLTGSDARVNYNDLDSNGNSAIVSDQQDITTSTGVVSLNADTYSVGSNVVITLEDADLNTDSGSAESYTVAMVGDDNVDTYDAGEGDNDRVDPDRDQVGEGVDNDVDDTNHETLLPGGNSLGMLLEVAFDGERWQAAPRADDDDDRTCTLGGLGATGFTLLETGPATGVFTGSFAIPESYCTFGDNGLSNGDDITRGKDISVTYIDFSDASSQIVTTGDSAAIGASTGSISLDRTVYPVPFGDNNEYRFQTHPDGPDDADDELQEGIVTAYIQVNDPDFNLSPTGTDTIDADGNGPVSISVTRGSDEVTLGFAGGDQRAGTLFDGSPDNPPNTIPLLGPMTETSPESGIFEIALDIQYTDGPQSNDCEDSPDMTPNDNDDDTTFVDERFGRADDDDGTNDNYCILQGDILTVQYTDPADASGNERTVTDSATFDLRNGALQTDKSVYVIGTDMIVTLIDPDLDLDSDVQETYTLDLIGWDSDADTTTLSNDAFDASAGSVQETGPSTGIFQVVIEVPRELDDDRLERGEEITLTYVDWGPSGADYVGEDDEEIERTVFTSNFGATIELDQAVYTWTDKVFITITAPDHNQESNQVDEIGNTEEYPIRVATRSDELDDYTLVETGTDTGIFTGEVILTGFGYDADGNPDTGNANGEDTNPDTDGTGPTDGLLEAERNDGLEVSFEFSEDEFVRTSALIRWNIAEVQWLEASYPATSSGVLRVIDADMNLNPEAVDNFEVRVWSSSSLSGITLTVTETQPASGIFEGTVFFGLDVSSGGHRLNVDEGDTITARYDDNTLPDPYNRGDSESITATTIIGTIVPPLERVGIESLRAVDATGTTLSTVTVDQQIQITSDLTNKQDKDQPFAYLVQIQDADGVTVSLSWIDGSLTPNQSLSPSVSWTPTAPGTYTVTVFAWESVSTPTALSPQQQTTITVN